MAGRRRKSTCRPRADVVIRRFLDGESLSGIVRYLHFSKGWRRTDAIQWLEQAIRRAFERADKAKGRRQ